MFSITTLLVGCIVGQTLQTTDTPEKWLDEGLDSRDRASIEAMVSFAPPEFSEEATWVLPTGQDAPKWKNLLGKVVVVQSWTNSTPKGRQAAYAARNSVSKTKTPEDVVLITVHTPEGHTSAETYIAKKKFSFPTVVDPTGEICNQFGFFVKPTNFVIDRNGAVRHVGLQKKWLVEAVDELLSQPFNPEVETKTYNQTDEGIEAIATGSYPEHNESFGSAKDQQGKKAPKFIVEEWVSGKTGVKNKTRIVEFWATWCGPCIRSIPHMNDLQKHFGERLAIIGVSGESASKVKAFIKKTKMNYGVAVDTKKRMQNSVSCRGIPLAMVISSDDIVRWQGHPSKLTERLIQQILDADGGVGKLFPRGRWDVTADHG